MDDFIHLNDFYQQQINWLRTLKPEQLGIKKTYSYPNPASSAANSQASSFVDAEIRRGSYFTSPIQFPTTSALPLSLKNSDTPCVEGQLILEAHLDERVFKEEGVKVKPYKEAIEAFQHMNDIITPADMCYCLTDTIEIIYSLANYYERLNIDDIASETKVIGADDFLPILLYVVIHANVIGTHRIVHILNHYNSPWDLKSEIGYYISALHSVNDMILHAKKCDYGVREYDTPELSSKFHLSNTDIATMLTLDSPTDDLETMLTFTPNSI